MSIHFVLFYLTRASFFSFFLKGWEEEEEGAKEVQTDASGEEGNGHGSGMVNMVTYRFRICFGSGNSISCCVQQQGGRNNGNQV